MSYSDLLTTRTDKIDDIGDWMWVKGDDGAWDGPHKDWETSHKFKYMKYLKNNSAVITAGANLGLHARLFADIFDTVWAFEPDPLNFHCLVNNCQRDNVIKIQAALGHEHKMIAMQRHTMTNVGMHTIMDNIDNGRIPMLTIDSLNVNACSLLQLDVEGYEIYAIAGAYNTIKKFQPVIAAERSEYPEIIEFMTKGLNYKIADRSISDTIWIPST